MNWIIFHIASGEAFFTGAVMAVAGVCARFSGNTGFGDALRAAVTESEREF